MNELNNQQSSGKSNDEIDLFELFSRVWLGFRNFFAAIKDFFVAFIIFTIRKSLWVGSFALIGILVGFLYSKAIRKSYYSSMLEGNSGGVSNAVVIDHINQLERMVKKPEILANFLNMSLEEAKQIHSIKAFYGIDVNFDGIYDYVDEKNAYNPRSLKDTLMIRVPSIFFVKVQMYDEGILPVLRDRLFQHINNNAHIQTLFEADKSQKQALIDELDNEINRVVRLDSLQHLQRTGRDRGLDMAGEKVYLFGSSEPELKLFNAEILSMHERKQELKRELDIQKDPVVVVHDFIAAQWEEKTTSYYAFTLGFILIIIGYVFAICWTFRKRLKKIIMEEPIKYFDTQ